MTWAKELNACMLHVLLTSGKEKFEKYSLRRQAEYKRRRERILKYQEEYRAANKQKIADREKIYRLNNQEKLRADKKRDYEANRERYLAKFAEWRRKNPNWGREKYASKKDEINATRRAYLAKKSQEDPRFKATRSLRSRIWSLIKANKIRKLGPTGLTKAELCAHLEQQFLPGMTWQNYGRVWHVDHIVPCSAFNLTDHEQIKKCFALSNLQPLWAKDNLKKHNSLDWDNHNPL